MRYEYLISRNLALLDLPVENYGQVKQKGRNQKQNRYLHKIFRKLLVYDQIPDDLEAVLEETGKILESPDPAFEVLFPNKFEEFITTKRPAYVWGKVKKDYHAYIRAEVKRRNSDNPYYNPAPRKIESWDALPNFSRQKRNQPWQFDSVCRDSQILAGEIYELLKRLPNQQDKDLFRAKISSILVPEKIIFALNGNGESFGFAENEITLANVKLSLDGYKLSYTFLNKVIESLHKIRWSNESEGQIIDQTILFADKTLEKIKLRISEVERRFMLFVEAIEQDNREEE